MAKRINNSRLTDFFYGHNHKNMIYFKVFKAVGVKSQKFQFVIYECS